MPSNERFIPITISLDGTQATSDFKQFADNIAATARQMSQSIIDANSRAFNSFISASQSAYQQYQATQTQMTETAQQTIEIQERMAEKIGDVAENINKLSEGFERLSESIKESGEKSESFLTKYHEGAASILYTMEIFETAPEFIKHSKEALDKFGNSATKAIDGLRNIKIDWPERPLAVFTEGLSKLGQIATYAKDKIITGTSAIGGGIKGLFEYTPPLSILRETLDENSAAAAKAVAGTQSVASTMAAVTPVIEAETVGVEGATAAFAGLNASIFLIPAALGLVALGIYELVNYKKEFIDVTENEIRSLGKEASQFRSLQSAINNSTSDQQELLEKQQATSTAYQQVDDVARARIRTTESETEKTKLLNEEITRNLELKGFEQKRQGDNLIQQFQTRYQELLSAREDLERAKRAFDEHKDNLVVTRMAGHGNFTYEVTQDYANELEAAKKKEKELFDTTKILGEKIETVGTLSNHTTAELFNFSKTTSGATGDSHDFEKALADVADRQKSFGSETQNTTKDIDNQSSAVQNLQDQIKNLASGDAMRVVQKKTAEVAASAVLQHKTAEDAINQLASDKVFQDNLQKSNAQRQIEEKIKEHYKLSSSPRGRESRVRASKTSSETPTLNLDADLARTTRALAEYGQAVKSTAADEQLWDRLIDSVNGKEKVRIAGYTDLQKAIEEVDKLNPGKHIAEQSLEYRKLNAQLAEKKKADDDNQKAGQIIKGLLDEQTQRLREFGKAETEVEKTNLALSDPAVASALGKDSELLEKRNKALKNAALIDAKPISDQFKNALADIDAQIDNLKLEGIDSPIDRLRAQLDKTNSKLPLTKSVEDIANLTKLKASQEQLLQLTQQGIDKRKNDETINKYNEETKQLNDQLQQGLHLTQTQTLELRIQRGEFGAISDEQAKGLLSLSRSVEEQQKFQERTQKIKETLASAFEQGLQHGPKAFFKSLFDSFTQTIFKMESEWAASKVMQFLFPTKSATAAGHSGGNGNPIQSVIDHVRNLSNQSSGNSSSEIMKSGIEQGSSLSKIPAVGNFLKGLPVISKLFDHGTKTATSAVAGKASSLADNALGAMKSGAGAAASSSGGILSKLGMAGMFSNPFSAAAAIAPIALPFIMKLFGGGIEKAIKNEVKKDYNVDIKDSKILQQIKSIGDQTFGKQLSSHIPQLVAMDQVKQIVTQDAMYKDPHFYETILGKTQHLTDISSKENQFIHETAAAAPPRAFGGPVAANMPYLVGEKRPELFIPRVDGTIHPDPIGDMTRRVLDGARSNMSTQTGNQGHSTNGLAYAIQSLVEQVSRFTAISPGQVLQTGAQQNPTAISGGLIEGLRQNFGHRRELNGITGA